MNYVYYHPATHVTSCAMTARYRRQVLMSLVHQLSYRSLGEVSNIGVTEAAGWRRFSDDAITPRSLDTSTPLSLLRRGYSGTSTSTTITTTPGCRRRRRHLASVRHPASLSLPPPLALLKDEDPLSRSIFILRRSTSRHAVLAQPSRQVAGSPVLSPYHRIFYPMLLAYFTRFVEYPRSESIRRNEGNVGVKVTPTCVESVIF